MNSSTRGVLIASLALAFALGAAGCEREGPAERTGQNIDRAAEEAGAKIDRAADEAGDKMEEARESVAD